MIHGLAVRASCLYLALKNLFRKLLAALRAVADTAEPKCQLISILSTHADHFLLMHMYEQILSSSVRILRKWLITDHQKQINKIFVSLCY